MTRSARTNSILAVTYILVFLAGVGFGYGAFVFETASPPRSIRPSQGERCGPERRQCNSSVSNMSNSSTSGAQHRPGDNININSVTSGGGRNSLRGERIEP